MDWRILVFYPEPEAKKMVEIWKAPRTKIQIGPKHQYNRSF